MQNNIPKSSKNLQSNEYKCDHCSKTFKTESGWLKHSCKFKKRWNDRNEQFFIKGFEIFQKFYFFHTRSKKEKTRDDFIESKYYDYFIKLSLFLSNGLVCYTDKYYYYLFKNNIKMVLWAEYDTYQKFLLDIYKTEEPHIAIERTLGYIGKWSSDLDIPWVDFFREISPGMATDWIRYGKISPWILYCNKGDFGLPLIERITDEQLNIIAKIIDPVLWQRRLALGEKKILDYIEMLKDQGM